MADEDEPFEPNWASAPGRSIRERLKHQGMTVGDFAVRLGLSVGDAEALLEGTLFIDDGLASRLAEVVSGTRQFWRRREDQFVADLARLGRTREGHVRREKDKEIVAGLIEEAVRAGDRKSTNAAVADCFEVLDRLHDDLEAARR